jgi:hypothetical protein
MSSNLPVEDASAAVPVTDRELTAWTLIADDATPPRLGHTNWPMIVRSLIAQVRRLEEGVPDIPFAEMDRNARQEQAVAWAKRAFGDNVVNYPAERGARVQEEANELGQAMGVPRETAHKIVDYVYDRPSGEVDQEIGDIGLCLLIAAASLKLSADEAERAELNRVLAKPPEHFLARHKAKAEHGITPGLSTRRA